MPTKPKFINIMSFIFIALALSFPVQIMFMFKLPPWHIGILASKLTPLNYLLMGLFLYTAYLTYKTNKLVFIILPIVNFFVFLNNFIVAEYGQVFTHTQTVVASTAFLLLTLSFYQKDIYQVYSDLKFRWWLTSPRFKRQIPITIHYQGEKFQTSTFDISKTGMFIKTDDLYRIFKIENNKEIELSFKINNRTMKLTATVVRKSIAKGQYPAGIGVHFSQETPNELEELGMQSNLEQAA